MKYCHVVLLPIFFLLVGLSCQTNTPERQEGQTISAVLSPAEFESHLKKNISPQLIDVRTPDEFKDGHLENARNIDFFDPNFNTLMQAALSKKKAVYLYCKSGGRSGKTAARLQEMGFEEIYDLKGGYTAWAKYKAR